MFLESLAGYRTEQDYYEDYNAVKEIKYLIEQTQPKRIRLRLTLYKLRKHAGLSGYTSGVYNELTADMLSGAEPDPMQLKFKGLNANDYPLLLRRVLGETPTENDMVFVHEGRLAKFLS